MQRRVVDVGRNHRFHGLVLVLDVVVLLISDPSVLSSRYLQQQLAVVSASTPMSLHHPMRPTAWASTAALDQPRKWQNG